MSGSLWKGPIVSQNGFRTGTAASSVPLISQFNGNVFYVDSGSGAATNDGTSWDKALTTIDAAIGECTANNGDIIVVAAGHAETISAAAGIDADVAGISIIGLGNGDNRPVITFATATAADIDIDAAEILIKNIVFKNNIDSQTIMIDVNAVGFTLEDCEFREGSSKQWLTCIDLDGGTANAVDRTTIRNCKFVSYAAGANNAIKLAEVADEVLVEDCIIDGDFADAGIHNPTGKVLTNLRIRNNMVRNRQTGDHAIELVSACTGEAVGNHLFGDTLGTIFDPGSLFCSGNFESAAIDVPGVATPLAIQDAATNLLGADSSNNTAATTNVAANEDGSALERLEQIQEAVNKGTGTALAANKSLVDALGSDGTTVTDSAVSVLGAVGADNANNAFASTSVVANEDGSVLERLEQIQKAVNKGTGTAVAANKSLADAIGFDGSAAVTATAGMLRTMAGSVFVVKKTLTSSAVVQAGVDVTAVSTVGDIQIIDVLLQCDGTGLAAGTNFTLECNNTKGSAVFLSTAVSGLGAGAVMDLDSASTTSKTVVLESGKKIVAKSTVADCTGAGTVDVYLICRRLADNATLTAAA